MATKALVPHATQAATLATVTSIDVVLQRAQDIRANPNLTWKQKRIMIGTEIAVLLEARRRECEARLKIQEMKLSDDVAIAKRALDAYRVTVITEIDDELNKFMRKIGIRVNLERLRLIKDLGENLASFKRSIQADKLERRHLRVLFQEIDRTFDNVCEQLGRSAAQALQHAEAASE